jgi:hypothetical protein
MCNVQVVHQPRFVFCSSFSAINVRSLLYKTLPYLKFPYLDCCHTNCDAVIIFYACELNLGFTGAHLEGKNRT